MTINNEAVSNPAAQKDTVTSAEKMGQGTNDYTYVHHKARIACYDDPLSEPRIVEVSPAPTREFLTNLAQTIWQEARTWDSPIPYAVIADVSENFIHAQFSEMVVSIFDHGNTIRFSDQGPGIPHKDQVQEWGFSTATEPMKEYIHGVGSGLPRVKEFLACKNGTISIEDNLGSGAVVTISFNETDDDFDEDEFEASSDYIHEAITSYQNGYAIPIQPHHAQEVYQNPYSYGTGQPINPYPQPTQYGYPQPINQGYPQQIQATPQQPIYNTQQMGIPPVQGYYPPQTTPAPQAYSQGYTPPFIETANIVKGLTNRDLQVLLCFTPGAYLRNKEIENICSLSASTVNNSLKKVENQGLVKKMQNKSRVLTDLGVSVVAYIKQNNTRI